MLQIVVQQTASWEDGQCTDFKVDVLQAMHFAAAAWDHVSGTCVANCLRHAG